MTDDEARSQTYNAWSDNQLRSWLESRGIIQSGTEKKRDDLLSLVADNYYSLRDRAYETWDDATLRSYLSSQGAAASSYADSVQRSDLVKNVREYYYSTQDKVYDTWSDKDIRKWLERNGVVKSKKAETMRRDKLEEALESSWKGARENVEKTWKETEMRQVRPLLLPLPLSSHFADLGGVVARLQRLDQVGRPSQIRRPRQALFDQVLADDRQSFRVGHLER